LRPCAAPCPMSEKVLQHPTFHSIGDTVMKILATAAFCSIALGMLGGCNGGDGADPASADDDLQKVGGALSCSPDSGKEKLALVAAEKGKYALLTLTPAKDVFALSAETGTMTTTGANRSFKADKISLDLDGG